MAFPRHKVASLVLVAALVAVYFVLGPKIPRDQVVHVVLGNAAPRVTEVRARYAEAGARDGDFTREVTFRYAEGAAPRIITHEPRLPSGDYLVEIELHGRKPNEIAVVKRRITLQESPVSLDVQEAVP